MRIHRLGESYRVVTRDRKKHGVIENSTRKQRSSPGYFGSAKAGGDTRDAHARSSSVKASLHASPLHASFSACQSFSGTRWHLEP